jgi:hypothetical protein
MITQSQKHKQLMARIDQLHFFAQTFSEKPNALIEHAAYLVLETYHSRPAAIWRYFVWAVNDYLGTVRCEMEFRARHLWLRYGKRMSAEQVIALYERELGESEEFCRMLVKDGEA